MGTSQWFDNELNEWQAAGIIDAEQASAIRARYANAHSMPTNVGQSLPYPPAPADQSNSTVADSADGKDKLVAVISTIGALVLGLGVILLVAANWDGITPAQRFVMLLAGTAGMYVLGWRMKDSGGHPQLATSVLLLATMLFGASIFLIGQTYHVEAHDPLAFLVIAVVAIALALILDSRPHGGLGVVSLATWWVYEIGSLMSDSQNEGDFFALTVVAALGGLTIFGAGQAFRSLAVEKMPDLRSLASPFRIAGFVILSGSLVVLSLAHRMGESYGQTNGFWYLLVAFLIAAVAAVGLYFAGDEAHAPTEAAGLLVLDIALVVSALGSSPYFISAVANIALVALALGGIAVGVARRDRAIYGLAVTVAVIDIVVRYFDFLFNTLGGGFFFVGAGVVLIGIGWLISRTRQVWKEQTAA